jgi:hypothetical protein
MRGSAVRKRRLTRNVLGARSGIRLVLLTGTQIMLDGGVVPTL